MVVLTTCKRAVQKTLELDFLEIVELLLNYGADIDTKQPLWEWHDCEIIPTCGIIP
jgi:hypothetical protein